jgi:hypothetical protein
VNLGENRTGVRILRLTRLAQPSVFRLPKPFLFESVTASGKDLGRSAEGPKEKGLGRFRCFEVGPVARRLDASGHSRTVPKKTLQLLRSSDFFHFSCPFLELLRRPEVRREGKPLPRGVAMVGGPGTGARFARPPSASS